MSQIFTDWMAMPGPQAARETAENTFIMQPRTALFSYGVTIGGAARDAGNTGTGGAITILRPGLAMGLKTSDSKYYQWDPTAVDGTQTFQGFFAGPPLRMLDGDGNSADRQGMLVIAGAVKAANVYQSQNINSYGITNALRAVAACHFQFSDDFYGRQGPLAIRQEVVKAANYPVVAADAGTRFTTSTGAVTFTLPAIASAAGLQFEFLNLVDFNMTITSAEGDNIVAMNDASADSVAFSTATEKVGAFVRFAANAAGTKWYWEKLCVNTVTIAT